MATYPVQIVNERHQIVLLKVRHTLSIPFPVEDVAELIVEPGRGSVEKMELLHEVVRGHEECASSGGCGRLSLRTR